MTSIVAPTTGSALDVVCARQAASRAAEVSYLAGVLDWAVGHPPLDEADVACYQDRGGPMSGEPEFALNSVGVPVVSAVGIAELAAGLGLSQESGRVLVSDVMELAYRLPRMWERLQAGKVPVWQARKLARLTAGLHPNAVAYIDAQVGIMTGRISMVQVERLVDEAIMRFDPHTHAERVAAGAEHRSFDVELGQTTTGGLVRVDGMIELPDALALESAVSHSANQLARLGSSESLPARRARAVGEISREHLDLWQQSAPGPDTLALPETDPGPIDTRDGQQHITTPASATAPGCWLTPTPAPAPPPAPPPAPAPVTGGRGGGRGGGRARRELVLHVHIDASVLDGGSGPGRVDNHNELVDASAIRRWCGAQGTRLVVLPVLDTRQDLHHDRYEIPNRLREHVINRDVTCVYPGCRRPARACDLDHIVPFNHDDPGAGGQTSTTNLAALCRHHHNLKTRDRLSYQMITPGTYQWTFPEGTTVIRGPGGTMLKDRPRRRPSSQPTTRPPPT